MDSGNKYDIEEMAGFAKDIIRQAGDHALEFYGKGKPQIKFDEDLVTKAELSLFDFFTRQLETRFPDHHAFREMSIFRNIPTRPNDTSGYSILWTEWPTFRPASLSGARPWLCWTTTGPP